MSIAAAKACTDRRAVLRMVRQLYVPADGTRNLVMSGDSVSSSFTTAARRSSALLTLVTLTRPPPRLGSHATGLRRLPTSPLRQSPYILAKNGSKRVRPGSSLTARGGTVGPSGERKAEWALVSG